MYIMYIMEEICMQSPYESRHFSQLFIGANLSEPHIDEFAVNFRKSLPALILPLSNLHLLYIVP